MEIPKLAVIGNCSSRATLLSAWCLVFITAPALLLTACGNRELKASAISSEPTPVDVVRVHQANTSPSWMTTGMEAAIGERALPPKISWHVRRHGRVYVINKKNPRMKCRQG